MLPPLPGSLRPRGPSASVFYSRLAALFAEMDRAYAASAARSGFHCTGCEENCCRTRFYHHTWLEIHNLFGGYRKLTAPRRAQVAKKAADVLEQERRAAARGEAARAMCPLNFNGRCSLYDHRPMICRLHGIPHVIRRPDGQAVFGPGCEAFGRSCGHQPAATLDRTPFYAEMARLEQEFRRHLQIAGKVRLTVAEIIVGF
jgi:Fe-S-cluster containining protein